VGEETRSISPKTSLIFLFEAILCSAQYFFLLAVPILLVLFIILVKSKDIQKNVIVNIALSKVIMPFLNGIMDHYILSLILLLLLCFIWAYLKTKNYTYGILKNGLRIQWGVFKREETLIPYDSIHLISAERRFLDRMLGLTRLMIITSSGGTGGKPIGYLSTFLLSFSSKVKCIYGLSLTEAREMHDLLLVKSGSKAEKMNDSKDMTTVPTRAFLPLAFSNLYNPLWFIPYFMVLFGLMGTIVQVNIYLLMFFCALITVLLIIIWSYLETRSLKYFFGKNMVVIEYGVVSKMFRSALYKNIQSAVIRRRFLDRITNLSLIEITMVGATKFWWIPAEPKEAESIKNKLTNVNPARKLTKL